jgi:hypothetical protein
MLPDGFDPGRLQRLLDLVGPDQAPILLAQLRLDLAGCADSIARAVPGPDWETLREASHVLISLAGSAGAMRLHENAQALNAAAHAAHPAALVGLLPQLRADLDTLIALVEAAPAQASR